MQLSLKCLVAATAAVATLASAQTSTTTPQTQNNRTVGEATRDGANAVGRAASAAVTPGDQNMGRNPNNRSGGMMGNDRDGTGAGTAAGRAAEAAVTPGDQNMGRTPNNRSGGLMGQDNNGSNSSMNGQRSARTGRADRN